MAIEFLESAEQAKPVLSSTGVAPLPGVGLPLPISLHWLGDRHDAKLSEHAQDARGCVAYFDRQSDCLQFMRWLTEASNVQNATGLTPSQLTEQRRELLAALEPFGDIDGEGDEDFSNKTQITLTYGRTIFYALTLGDLRRARAVLAKATGSAS